MEENNNVTSQNGGPYPRATEPTKSRQMLSNGKLARKGDRTCAQLGRIQAKKFQTVLPQTYAVGNLFNIGG